ncbi:hypothetical protein D9757_012819 [Collybiopsis confluens]|uniref:Protein kinase domain-containing protein n=1 Tax=Collybiopsis confluens TaxID=2823264 RepID=A0A8H5G035_9AGAR|nr:hypothetical protein D9757_012819 [Collybiopsis confluens]
MVPEVEVEWFFENVLPDPIEGFDVGAVVEELRKSGMITASGWEAFPNNPKDDSRHENMVYGQLNSVFDAVIKATNSLYPGHTQQFSLVMLPNRPPSSERTSRTEPDATFLPTNIARDLNIDKKKAPYSWYDLANPAEFKKEPETSIKIRNMNVAQVVSSLQFIMTVDPLRRFSFGWTMQNCDLRIWFACRGVIFVTKAVDAFMNPDSLVRFFASIAFSSRTALGWDPTMEVICSSAAPRQYNITVNGQKFSTVKNLADYSADSLVSRATRVWLVKDEEGREYVLKDVWMDTDRLPEHEICAILLKDVLKKRGLDDHRTLSNHMLTARVFERMKIDGMDDTTPRMMNEQTPTTSSVFDLAIPILVPASARSSHPSETSSQDNRSETSKRTSVYIQTTCSPKLTIRSKYHYRIVFEEDGTDLYSEMSLHNVFKTLSDLVDALDIIHNSGWVHRDISCGNVYWFHDPDGGPSRGIVGDFEYAKRCDDLIEHQKRTGTSEFMAHEAALQEYDHVNYTRAPRGVKKATFAHNPLHDLESLWWLLVYIFLHRDDKGEAAKNPETRNDNADRLFNTGPGSIFRGMFMKDPGSIDLGSTGVAHSFEPALRVAQDLAIELLVGYEGAEAPYTEIDKKKCLIHGRFRHFLTNETTLGEIKSIELTPVVKTSAVLNSSGKRKEPPNDGNGMLEKRQSKRSKDLSNSPQLT